MQIDLFPVPAFNDNYIWMICCAQSRLAYAVDPGDATPVLEFLTAHQLTLAGILITHHHADHIGGLSRLVQKDMPIYGPAKEPIPYVNHRLQEGDHIKLAGTELTFQILNTPGHTLGHIAYYEANHNILLCGDTLFSAGCGRLFEGTPEQLYESLTKLARLPADTRVYCTHEYTQANLRFAQAAEPDNPRLSERIRQVQALRGKNLPSLPSTLKIELETNPFLHCNNARDFALLRSWKDRF